MMKLSAKLGLLTDLRAAFAVAFIPTLKHIWANPLLLLRPATLSRFFMNQVWTAFGAPTDEMGRPVKQDLISPYAKGGVLDIGAGHGHTIDYLDRTAVDVYIALEPNALMHEHIRARANAAGFHEENGKLLILRGCGAENINVIREQLDTAGTKVDTMISILTLCSIPDPQETLHRLVAEVLVPGGQFLFYEHVLSPLPEVAWWQRFWTPIWQFGFDGCRLDRPTHLWIENMPGPEGRGMWKDGKVWGKDGEPDEHLFWHRAGRFIKHSGS